MLLDIYLIEYLSDFSILVDKERLPGRSHVLLPVHAFFAPNAILLNDRLVGIRKQVELKSVLRSEFLVSLLVVDGDAQQLDVLIFKFVVRITERACFLRSTRCVVFRIEEKYYALAFEVGQFNGIAVLILRFEIRSFVTFFEHKPPMNVGLH